jgi:hypothetical protein
MSPRNSNPQYSIRSVSVDIETGDVLTAAQAANQKTVVVFDVAETIDEKYIGSPEMAKLLCDEHDVTPDLAYDIYGVCSVGFSITEQKWYGWAQTGYACFGVGDRVEPGSYAYKPSTRGEFLEMVLRRYEKKYENIKVRPEVEGFTIEYDVNEPEDPELVAQLTKIYGDRKIPKRQSAFVPYPEEFGRGVWTAETLDDARQMAIDFVNGSLY